MSTLMVSKAKSRTAHCFGVRFRVSSRTMWSWNPIENNIRKAQGSHKCRAFNSQFKNSPHTAALSPTSGPGHPPCSLTDPTSQEP